MRLSPQTPTSQPEDLAEIRRRGIRRTTWIASAIALAFYFGFIIHAVLRSRG